MPEWSLVRSLSATLDKDEDGSYVISDDIFTAYGVGDTYDEAYQDFIIAYFVFISTHAHHVPRLDN